MASANTLEQLKTRVLDENASLVNLLRMCLMLGKETGSEELRTWVSKELNGYDNNDVPDYRKCHAALFIDSISGNFKTTGQQVSPAQLPEIAREAVTNEMLFLQPIEELERMANSAQDSISFTMPGFADLAALWSSELDTFQQVHSIYYKVSTVTIAGVVGRVRTTLVELVSELVVEAPSNQLPTQSQVDQAVHVHVKGRKNTVSIASSSPAATVGQGNVVNQQSKVKTTQPEDKRDGFWTVPRRIWLAIAGVVALGAGIVQIVADWPF